MKFVLSLIFSISMASIFSISTAEASVCALEGRVCVGDLVIGKNGELSEVVGVFPFKKGGIYNYPEVAVMNQDGQVKKWEARLLMVASGCNSHVCVGDVVYTKDGIKATVAALEADSDFKVLITTNGGVDYLESYNTFLALSVPNCEGKLAARPVCN